MAIITLTSDFGLADGYVGTMKGVILGIAPLSQLVDLSHDIVPQAVSQAAFVLSRAVPFFPPHTVHLAIVDPGVGTSRRALLVTTPTATFVGPDNGLFTFALDTPGARAWVLDRPEYWLSTIGRTFHGRDIFAPVAAHLTAGVLPEQLASPVTDPVRTPQLHPARKDDGSIAGHIVYVDRFGNLMSNVPGDWLAGRLWICELGGRQVAGPHATYGVVADGELVLLVSSAGTAEVAVRNGSAAEQLALRAGAELRLYPQ